MRRWIACTAVAVVLTLAFGGGDALAYRATCGQLVGQSITLENDLVGCHGRALVIAADGITVDLGGHTIDGYDPNVGIGLYGISMTNHTGVTIKNGTITSFSGDVHIANSSGNRLSDLNTQGFIDEPGIRVDASSNDNVISGVHAGPSPYQAGILLEGDRNVVVDSFASALINCSRSGIEVKGDANTIEGSVIHNVRENVCGADGFSSPSLRIWSGDGNRILGNDISDGNGFGSPTDGLWVEAAATNTLVQGNVARRNSGDGIDVDSASTTLIGNLADGNYQQGITAPAGVKENSNTAQGNTQSPQCVNVRCERRLFGAGRALPASFSAMSGQVKRASPFTLYYPARIRKLYVYLDGRGAATGSQQVRGLLYGRAADGGPGALVAPTFDFTVPAGMPGRWVELFLAPPVHLEPGVYWLGIHSGDQGGVARFGWESKTGARHFNIDGYGDGPADPFGPSPADDQQMAIFATGAYGS